MIKLLKQIFPANHGAGRVIDVLESMAFIEWAKGIIITGLALIVLPMALLMWEVRDAIA